MTTDSIRTREVEILNFLRCNMTDPNARGSSKTDTFTATAGQTVFTLSIGLVKYITSVTVAGNTQYVGYNYSMNLGEGSDLTTITLKVAATLGQIVTVSYVYGDTMIYEGFQRLDSELPRISIINQNSTPEFMSIGEDGGYQEGGKYIYYNSYYVAEIRSRYAKQMKTVMHEFSNLIHRYRQNTPQPYMTIIVNVVSMNSFDFDQELRLYRAQVVYMCKWIVKFKD